MVFTTGSLVKLASIAVLSALSFLLPDTSVTSYAGLEPALDTLFAQVPDFSGVVLIADKGKPVYRKAFGFKNVETQAPMTVDAIFELASVSKQFTATTIMLLQQAGKLNYDDPVARYVPGLPYSNVTIRHLLNHTSGLPDYQAVMDTHWDKSKVAGNADNIAYLIRYRPPRLFEPGAKYLYSNTGYMLLASIAENASRQDFIDFCRTRIFRPVGMDQTDIRTQSVKSKLPAMAWGHIYVLEKQRYVRADSFPAFNYAIWLGNRKGPGRVSATADDLLKWDRALYTNEPVCQRSLQQAFSPARLNDSTLSPYGFGWELQQHPVLGKVVRHSGDNPGYKTQIIRYIDADKTIILLCNNDHPKMPYLLERIEALVGK